MATEGEAVFLTAELRMVGGTPLAVAPLYPEIAWLGDHMSAVAHNFEKAADKRWSRKGDLLEWMESVGRLDVAHDRIVVHFPASANPLQPELELHFDVLIGERVGLIPALGVGAYAEGGAAVRDAITANIQLEFARSKRLRDGRDVLSTQWYEGAAHSAEAVSATFYTFNEIRGFAEQRREDLLPKVAQKLALRGQQAFGVADRIDELRRLRSSRSCSNLLLVGASGVGKTALFEEFFRQEKVTVWTTTASRLERGLTSGGGWQENLGLVCKELQGSGDWLFVRNLAELFEVGRYVGNNTSIGEYLRPWLASGEISLFTECTDAQLARIDARYPGIVGLFRELKVSEPAPAAIESVIAERVSLTSGGRVGLDAVREIVRLQRRFTPYSGFPGKPIRFLEHLARATDGPIGGAETVGRFCEESGIPPMMIDRNIQLSVARIGGHFADRIYGQPTAVAAVVDTLVGVKAATSRGGKPIASLLFVGPTGVGKTETAKALATFMFGSKDRLVRFDMSEFSSPAAVFRLAGSGDGLLTGAVRRQPFSVLLFDEIEKADSTFFDLLLQVLGEGRLTDGKGRVADFCSAIVVMTSNIGARSASSKPTGFGRETSATEVASAYEDAVKAWFRPEFVNRIDRILPFSPLSRESIRAVLDLKLEELRRRTGFESRKITVNLTAAALSHLADVGYHPAYGARQLQRALADRVLSPAAGMVNDHAWKHPVTVTIDAQDGPDQSLSYGFVEQEEDVEAATTALALNEVADRATDARRLGWKVANGAAFAELRSAYDILERRRIRKKDDFWRNDADARRHGRLGEVLSGCQVVLAQIDDFEEETQLAAILGDLDAVPEQVARYAEFEGKRNQMFRRLYEILHAEQEPVCLGIYGDPERVRVHADVYAAIAKKLGLTTTTWEVWLLSEHAGKIVSREPGVTTELDVKPIGLELEITGPGAILAFENENGLLLEKSPQGDTRLRVVSVHAPHDKFSRPAEMHRKKAFETGNTLRTFTPDLVQSAVWKRGIDRALYAEKLHSLLHKRFWDRLLLEVCS